MLNRAVIVEFCTAADPPIPRLNVRSARDRNFGAMGGGGLYHYFASGLSIESELRLPGFRAYDILAAPDVTIRRSSLPDALQAPRAVGPTWAFDDSGFLLRVPDVGRFLISGGRTILFDTEGETEVEDLAAFIGGSVFGVMLHQRGQLLFHASAVLVDGCAVVFCGPSGAGKSTLAASLCQAGYPFVADDFCAIDLQGPAPMLMPDGRYLKLWANSIEGLTLGDCQGERVRRHLEKFYVAPEQAAGEPQLIGAVYILREARSHDIPGITTPNSADQTQALLANSYRPRLVERFNHGGTYFRGATRLANRVHTLTRPIDFAAAGQTISWLEEHWRLLGLRRSQP